MVVRHADGSPFSFTPVDLGTSGSFYADIQFEPESGESEGESRFLYTIYDNVLLTGERADGQTVKVQFSSFLEGPASQAATPLPIVGAGRFEPDAQQANLLSNLTSLNFEVRGSAGKDIYEQTLAYNLPLLADSEFLSQVPIDCG